MNIPKISVIIPLFNKEKAIKTTIYSVLCQTFGDFEIVVINDGATDNSVSVVQSIHDDRIRIIMQDNLGVSAARNHGIDEALGNWILFLDADDILLPNALMELYNIVNLNQVEVGCANFYILTKKYKLKRYIYSFNGVTNNINKQIVFDKAFMRTGNCLISKEILYKEHFNQNLKRYEDLDFFIRITHNRKVVISETPIMIYSYLYGSLASNFTNPSMDYLTQIDFSDSNFWEKMLLSLILVRECHNYKSIKLLSLYPSMKFYFRIANIINIFLRIRKKLFKNK